VKMRRGQVALYLVLVLLAVAVLVFVCFNTFLAVRSKNRMMNAVDEAAITVARYQGYLLNEVGKANVEHLRDAIRGTNRDYWADDSNGGSDAPNGLVRLRELVLFGPLAALEKANAVARDWYPDETTVDAQELSGFLDHLSEIEGNPDVYSSDGGLWMRYAQALRTAVSSASCVLPGYMELARPTASGLFAAHSFYDVLAAKAWCWFTVGNNSQYLEAGAMSSEAFELGPVAAPENSEVFSLHVAFKTWAESPWGDSFDADWTNFVCQVTGLSPKDFSSRSYVTDPDQVWAFYDDNWSRWSATFNPDRFPIVGSVRPEYDVAGCVASCALVAGLSRMETKDDEVTFLRRMRVTAEAKPLGTVRGLDGATRAPVTAYNRFVASSHPDRQIFTEAQLVLMGAVPRSPGVSMESGWYEHVLHHGQEPSVGCGYCTLWRRWCDPSFRATIQDWLRRNSESCHPSGSCEKCERGGYEYAH